MPDKTISNSLRAVPATAQSADDRLPPIPEAEWTEEQRAAAAEFEALRGTKPAGPFLPLLHAPEVLKIANQMGNYLRFHTNFDMAQSELAILITARRWTQNYEWIVHRKIAEEAGLSKGIIDAIRDGRRPGDMSAEQTAIYDFCTELHRNGEVCDQTYAACHEAFGARGVIDLGAICGYYTTLAMIMNAARTPPPAGADPELKGFRG